MSVDFLRRVTQWVKRAVKRKHRDAEQPVKLWAFPVALAGVVSAGLAVFGGAAYGLWVSLGTPDLRGSTGWEAKDTLDLVRIALIVTGGLGGVVALVVAYRKQRLAEDSNRREEGANRRAELASRRDDTKLFNERFTAANAQLGNESAAVRLGAVYAIAGLADDWEAGRQTCIDVLCAYLRMPYQPDPEQSRWKEGEREVRLSIIGIVRDHLRIDPDPLRDARNWRGRDLDFTGTVFDGGDFTDAHFSGGMVRFTDAHFSGGTVAFSGATFSGGTVAFSGATFSGSRVRFVGTTFSGGRVWFSGATFSGGTVRFDEATFSGGTVGFNRATFSGGTVDLARVRDYSVPPSLPAWTEPPAGLLLP